MARGKPFPKGNKASPGRRSWASGLPPSERTLRKHAAADIRALARAEGEASLELLIAVRDNVKAGTAHRLAAAKELLDRGYGTPRQSVEVTNDTTVVHVAGDDFIERLGSRVTGIRERFSAQGLLPKPN